MIDAALGGIYDRIGALLRDRQLNDSSGARRFFVGLLQAENAEAFCRRLNVSRETYDDLRRQASDTA
jgi:hypothetical protein